VCGASESRLAKVSIFDDKIALDYYTGQRSESLEPHIFGIAATAYRNLVTTK
jgi:myosin heavy subunit